MGYESRFYVCNIYKYERKDGGVELWSDIIAVFDMSKMGWDFNDNFNRVSKQINFDLYDFDGEKIKEDNYGDVLRYVNLCTLIDMVREMIDGGDDYRRLAPFYQMMLQLQRDSDKWDELVVIRYGY